MHFWLKYKFSSKVILRYRFEVASLHRHRQGEFFEKQTLKGQFSAHIRQG